MFIQKVKLDLIAFCLHFYLNSIHTEFNLKEEVVIKYCPDEVDCNPMAEGLMANLFAAGSTIWVTFVNGQVSVGLVGGPTKIEAMLLPINVVRFGIKGEGAIWKFLTLEEVTESSKYM